MFEKPQTYIQLLDDVTQFRAQKFKAIGSLLASSTLHQLVNRRKERIHRHQERQNRFQIFNISSKIRQREEFYSDIIAYILDPQQLHGLRYEPVRLFIDMLNRCVVNNSSPHLNIDRTTFDNAQVTTEQGRVDILLNNGNAQYIIIENKINWAGDQNQQLSRYYEYVTNHQKGTVVAIVYLTPSIDKQPSNELPPEAQKLLAVLPIYHEQQDRTSATISVLTDWIDAVVTYANENTSDIDVLSFFRQFSLLLKQKGEKLMSDNDMRDFFKDVIGGDEKKCNATVDIVRLFLPYTKKAGVEGAVYLNKIHCELGEKRRTKAHEAGIWQDFVWIHCFGIVHDALANSNIESEIRLYGQGGYQTLSIELWPLHGTCTVDELFNFTQALNLPSNINTDHGACVMLFGNNGIPYVDNEQAFYDKVDEVLDTILKHQTSK